MRHLNYSHLLYFWTVAREGSIAAASQQLHLTPQTISAQLKLLDESIGQPLFERVGRNLVLTETGHLVNKYADEIFALGSELTQVVKTGRTITPETLNVGIVSSIAKLITYRVLEPALSSSADMKVTCTEGELESLLAELAVHRLDLVLSDRAVPPGLNLRAYSHPIGDSRIALFGARKIAEKYRRRFPESLDQAPMLLPVESHAIRRALDDWFDQQSVTPEVIAEFDDSALMKAFGEAGAGLFPAPLAIESEIRSKYRVVPVGTISSLKETYYAISPERKVKHPSVVEIIETAREQLFVPVES